MSATITILGIDLASQAKNTAACVISCDPDGVAEVEAPRVNLSDEDADGLHSLIQRADYIGIDAPFGWPEPFREAVVSRTVKKWDDTTSRAMRLRETDLQVQTAIESWPLSVSTDRIALAAMRAMALLDYFGILDKSGAAQAGGKSFFEVYPAASLHCWRIDRKGYKTVGEEARQKRYAMLSEAQARLKSLTIPPEYAESDHKLDSLISALTARAAALGKTVLPTDDQRARAEHEGWIHLPSVSLEHLF